MPATAKLSEPGTDHTPWSLEAKLDPAHNLANLRPGVENLQTMLPMLYSEGVRRGRLSLDRFIDVTSRNAAKLFGVYPRKGALGVGSDADIVVFDPDAERVISPNMLKSRAGYSVYDGWRVTGWPAQTLRRLAAARVRPMTWRAERSAAARYAVRAAYAIRMGLGPLACTH